ncbi:response regulator [Aequorivita capsosiphonis]|uniref:response regulator n=1 Tax=Aequorivita capsosiphonis TaxID=487317 RepID=UPI00047C2E87|nr:response regulator [Aequorivita capsosiphonis]
MELPNNLNFLLVEDMVSDTFLLQRQLKKISANPEIRFVDSEISLINALKTYIPDMVLTDFNLVGMTAFDVLRITKEYNKKIPVIVITGNLKYESDREELLRKGAEGFFLKEPINTLNERLLPLVSEIVERDKQQMEKLNSERRKYASGKSNSDFLREHNFGDREEEEQEKIEVASNSFWKNLRSLFGNSRG